MIGMRCHSLAGINIQQCNIREPQGTSWESHSYRAQTHGFRRHGTPIRCIIYVYISLSVPTHIYFATGHTILHLKMHTTSSQIYMRGGTTIYSKYMSIIAFYTFCTLCPGSQYLPCPQRMENMLCTGSVLRITSIHRRKETHCPQTSWCSNDF